MKKRKPYYLIIAVLCFASIFNLFLPYLKLPANVKGADGYILELQTAAIESNLISELAEELEMDENVVKRIAVSINRGKTLEEIAELSDSKGSYNYNVILTGINNKVAELKEVDSFKETTFSYFGLIKLSVSTVRHLNHSVINAFLVILCLIITLVYPLVAGVIVLMNKRTKGYKFVLRMAWINIILGFLGLITINAVSIGALQIKDFLISYWGPGFFLVMILAALIWIVATAASIHEKVEGYISWRIIVKQNQLILITVPYIIYALIFYYGPLVGWLMAFQNFKSFRTISQQVWVGWDKFIFMFTETNFIQVIRNTFAMSFITLVLSFACAIGFALLLNEVVSLRGKKFVQTVSYLPHFLSWIIVTGIVADVLSMETGIINQALVKLNVFETPVNFFADPKYFWWIVGLANVWKSTGWNSIIYLAAITAISPELYEAASIDGAGRFRKMLHITLPGIRSTIIILLIINIGFILNTGLEIQYLLGNNGLIQSVSRTIDIYVLRYGISMGDASLGTAAGIFKSVVSILLIFLANRFAKAVGEERLF